MKMPQLESLTGVRGAAGTEGARRATGVSADEPVAGGVAQSPPDPEVADRPKRRRFTAEYKRKILKQADACTRHGELGALLRREGVYSSSLTAWRSARDRGELAGLTPKKRGPKASAPDPRDRELAAKDREIARLSARAERAEALIDVQKKLSQILGIRLPDSDDKP
jgi:transposase-like protein